MSQRSVQGSTIIIKSQNADGEEVEEIEIDTGLLEQLSNSGTVSAGDMIVDDSELADIPSIFYNVNQNQMNSMGGATYILNQETGEIQLLSLGNSATATMIDGEEVEVVTVDTDQIFAEDSSLVYNDAIQLTGEDEGYRGPEESLGLVSGSQLRTNLGRTAVASSSPVPRLKNAPALLRNSRRIATTEPDPLGGNIRNSASGSSMSASLSQSPRNRPPRKFTENLIGKANSRKVRQPAYGADVRTKPPPKLLQRSVLRVSPSPSHTSVLNPDRNSAQQVIMVDTSDMSQINRIEEPGPSFKMNSHISASMHVSTQEDTKKQLAYFIYQDVNGDQVAEIVGDAGSSLDQTSSSSIYHFDSDSLFLNADDLVVGDTVSVNVSTDVKSKKRSKKTTQQGHDSNSLSKVKKGSTELKCLERGCSAVAYNVADLRKHLTMYHDMTFDMDTVLFSSESAFKEWREEYERERMVSFIYRGGTKKIAKDQAVTYMICHRSGHYKPTMVDVSKRKRKMKPQGSCKIGGYCTAGIKLLKNLDTGEIKMDICHTHYGHPLDSEAIPHLRVNPTLRKMILKKFEEGMNFTDVLAYIHHNPDGLEGLRMVDRRAVRNIYDTWKNPVKRSKKLVVKNDMDIDAAQESVDNATNFNTEDSEDRVMDNTLEIVVPEVEDQVEVIPVGSVDHPFSFTNDSCTDVGISITKGEPVNAENEEMNNSQNDSVNDPDVTEMPSQLMDEQSMDPSEDSAPVLRAACEMYEEYDDQMDDDSSPPLLIAIESIKSLKPASPPPDTPRKVQKGKKKNKGKKKLKLKRDAKGGIPKSVSIMTGSVKESTSELPSKVSYTLRPNRKVEIYNKTRLGRKSAEIPSEKPSEEDACTGNAKPMKKEKNEPFETPIINDDFVNVPSPPPPVVDLNLSNSPTFLPLEENSDFEMMQIHISPELEAAIDKLHNHGESGPSLLLYKKIGEINTKYGGFCRAFREDDFCLIIQTPVQRQIMQMFPKTIGIEILDGPKPNEHDLKLAFVMVLDDFREAIPVAWLIADTMCSRILNQFFRMLRYHCGELNVHYMMAPRNAEVYKTWTAHFSNKPKMLQSEFCARRDLRNLVNRHFPNDCTRSRTWGIVESIVSESSIDRVSDLKKEISSIVLEYPNANGANFLKKLEKDWFSRIEEWSFAFRVNATTNLLFVAESFSRLKKFVGFKGTKKLNQSVDHILKIGYDKCFLRTKRMFKGDQKFSNLLEKVEECHNASRETLSNVIITEYENEHRWKVETTESDVAVAEVFYLQSPCDCKITCKVCNICMHQYMCDCEDFLKQQIMCAHIHRVHCFRNNISDQETNQVEVDIQECDISENEILTAVPGITVTDRSNVAICEGTEITILNENQIEGLNISDVLQAAAGLFSREDGQEMPKIVSITDADTHKVIYESSGSGPIIFQFDAE